MTKEEAVSIIEERIRVTECVESSYVDCVDIEALRIAIKALQQPEQRWIPCSERLPEEDKNVLVSVHFMGLKQTHANGWNDHIKPSYYVDIASHIDGEWSSASAEYMVAISRHKVIAWMPLPESYKERREENDK